MGAVPTVAGWWSGRSDPQRLELYTRSSYYSTIAAAPALTLLLVAPSAGARPLTAALFVLGSAAVTVAALLLARAGLASRPQGGPVPARLVGGAVALALVTAGAGAAAVPDDGGDSVLPWCLALPAIVVLVAGSTVWPARVLTAGSALVGAATAVGLVAAGRHPVQALTLGVLFGATAAGLALSFRLSVWVLDVVGELERARDVQARLAVAEERLRFARDLHDVMGRNLSAIAVKGHLAAELVRRGRDDAAGEVADISRIAEESLREIRGVVGGYRSASLPGELAGARSLLGAAGVACTVTGDDEAAFLPVPVQAVLGWAVRESVTNVLRHSRATTCAIALQVDGGSAELRVVNDGAAATTDPAWGSGLSGLAERLSAAGGRLSATSGDGRFVLAATLPVAVAA
jgi:two-component system, NarL family, sensor histidine kinase DesK